MTSDWYDDVLASKLENLQQDLKKSFLYLTSKLKIEIDTLMLFTVTHNKHKKVIPSDSRVGLRYNLPSCI